MTNAGLDSQTVRAVIREVLAELLPETLAAARANGTAPPDGRPGTMQPGPGQPGVAQPGLAYTVRDDVQSVETVSLRTDADLGAFVKHLLRLFESPKHRDALRSGRLRFRLAPTALPGSALPAHRIEKGAVTEAMVADAARAGAGLVLGRRAVLTPLARDRARAAGVEIEKER
jgi:hypothetical protein